jgi:hypothetical protein
MLNENTAPCKLLVICFPLFGQPVFLACLYRNIAVPMIGFYSQIPKISVKRNRIADAFSNGILVNLKTVFAAFCFLRVNDLKAVPLYYYLRF